MDGITPVLVGTKFNQHDINYIVNEYVVCVSFPKKFKARSILGFSIFQILEYWRLVEHTYSENPKFKDV